jgi:hypothetical protein
VAEIAATPRATRLSRIALRPSRLSAADVGFAALIAVPLAVSMVLRALSPVWLRASLIVDSQLFGQLAGNLADGQWLGPFDGRNLTKGPSYPIFIAASYDAHVPLVMAEQLLYLTAAGVVAVSLGRLGRSRWLGGTVFAALALNPIHLGAAGSSVVREVVYTSFSLLLLGLVLLVVSLVPRLAHTKRQWGFSLIVVGGGFIGVVGAAYYLCREERGWIAPAVAVALGAGVVAWKDRGAIGLCAWLGVGVMVVAAVGCGFAVVNFVVQENKAKYGSGVISDLADGQLARAYTDWQSVQAGPPRRWIPISRAARLEIYRVSPAAAELKPFLEGSPKRFAGCRSQACEYDGAFFIWAMRDAIARSGHLRTEADLQQFSRRLADEVEAACRARTLRCHRPILPLAPRLSSADVGPIFRSAASNMEYLLTFDAASPTRPEPSEGSAWAWQQMTRAIPATSDQTRYRADEKAAMARQGPVSALAGSYRLLVIPAVILAIGGLLSELVRPRRGRALGVALAAVLIAFLGRLAVLALVDALAYPASHNAEYAIPGSDLLVLFTVAGCWIMASRLLGWASARRQLRSAVTDSLEKGDRAKAAVDGAESSSVEPQASPRAVSQTLADELGRPRPAGHSTNGRD